MSTNAVGSQSEPVAGYSAPAWPSLTHWVMGNDSDQQDNALWYKSDIAVFTFVWTLIFFAVVYSLAGLWAYRVFFRSKLGIVFFLGFVAIGLACGAASGAVVGVVIGSLYNAGYFGMATWIPLAWGLVQILIAIVSSYSEATMTTI
ncbi:hypothetical protein HK097_006112 [Rhizophlyctis rosea]|uniref:Integral membrane protein n=1 Tax=Rhizophlyctis rosea TaxID=64517 RepID=A0AAD5X592_9FUNG|nr:hypothetical protein HK097_006112 [Rhizophlyctis rosea]